MLNGCLINTFDSCSRSTFVYGPAIPTPEGVWASGQATCSGNRNMCIW